MSIESAKQHIRKAIRDFKVEINMTLPLQSISSTNNFEINTADDLNQALDEMSKEGEIKKTDNHSIIRLK